MIKKLVAVYEDKAVATAILIFVSFIMFAPEKLVFSKIKLEVLPEDLFLARVIVSIIMIIYCPIAILAIQRIKEEIKYLFKN